MRNIDELGIERQADHPGLATMEMIERFEKDYNSSLPDSYRYFLMNYNGRRVDVDSFNSLSRTVLSCISDLFYLSGDQDAAYGLRSSTDALRRILESEEMTLIQDATNGKIYFEMTDYLTGEEKQVEPDPYPVAIGVDGGGNIIFIDSRDQGIFFFYFGLFSIIPLAHSFEQFIDSLYYAL